MCPWKVIFMTLLPQIAFESRFKRIQEPVAAPIPKKKAAAAAAAPAPAPVASPAPPPTPPPAKVVFRSPPITPVSAGVPSDSSSEASETEIDVSYDSTIQDLKGQVKYYFSMLKL